MWFFACAERADVKFLSFFFLLFFFCLGGVSAEGPLVFLEGIQACFKFATLALGSSLPRRNRVSFLKWLAWTWLPTFLFHLYFWSSQEGVADFMNEELMEARFRHPLYMFATISVAILIQELWCLFLCVQLCTCIRKNMIPTVMKANWMWQLLGWHHRRLLISFRWFPFWAWGFSSFFSGGQIVPRNKPKRSCMLWMMRTFGRRLGSIWNLTPTCFLRVVSPVFGVDNLAASD